MIFICSTLAAGTCRVVDAVIILGFGCLVLFCALNRKCHLQLIFRWRMIDIIFVEKSASWVFNQINSHYSLVD